MPETFHMLQREGRGKPFLWTPVAGERVEFEELKGVKLFYCELNDFCYLIHEDTGLIVTFGASRKRVVFKTKKNFTDCDPKAVDEQFHRDFLLMGVPPKSDPSV